jgi:2-polyprenyl-3-methyl-5-hydroxy-6-metoxy-1,4-benzoquinol methylase
MTDFSRRHDGPELMDTEEPPREEFARTLRELDFINRTLGGHAATLAALETLVPRGLGRLKVLDVGCADGAAAVLIQDWARERGLQAEVHGIDLSESSLALAEPRARPGLTFERRDLFDLPEAATYDVVHASLMLHHCPGGAAARALQAMYARARLGVALNDLHRHPAAFHAISVLTRAFSRDRLIRHDAPLSVLRGFTRAELEGLCREAGLPSPELRWRWAFRWSLVVRR